MSSEDMMNRNWEWQSDEYHRVDNGSVYSGGKGSRPCYQDLLVSLEVRKLNFLSVGKVLEAQRTHMDP